jgi:uncharacterized protein YegJ (DUF2314 family)
MDLAKVMAVTSLTVALGGYPCAQAQGITEKAKKDEIIHMPSEEPAMAAAFRKAQASLDGFLDIAKSPPADLKSIALKVRITEGGNSEYFWITPFRVEDDGFSGTLNNEPRVVRSVKNGQQLKFKRSDVVDWMYFDAGKGQMHGNFTACALLTRESAQERERFKRAYGLNCDG